MIDRDDKEFDRLCSSSPGNDRAYLDLLQRMLREAKHGELAPEKRRVLIIIPDLHVGGGQMVAIRLANGSPLGTM